MKTTFPNQVPKYAYKLLTPALTTYNGYQWVVGEWQETDGTGGLCGPGWLHAYPTATIAHFLNPIHASISNPVLWRVEVRGRYKSDKGLKVGYTKMRLDACVPMPQPTTEQRIRFAIGCAASTGVETDLPAWKSWAERWIANNRADSRKVALAAKAKVEAAAWAAWAAKAAAETAAWAEAEAEAAWAAAWAAEHDQTIDLEGIAQWAYTTEPLATLTRYIQEKK